VQTAPSLSYACLACWDRNTFVGSSYSSHIRYLPKKKLFRVLNSRVNLKIYTFYIGLRFVGGGSKIILQQEFNSFVVHLTN